ILSGYPDFTVFFVAGKCVRLGLGRQLYDPATQFAMQRQLVPGLADRRNPLPPDNHPPFEALLFALLSPFSYFTAYCLWAGFSVALLIAFWLLLRSRLSGLRAFSATLPVLAPFAFFPVCMALLQGQNSILVLLAYTLAFLAFVRGRCFLA